MATLFRCVPPWCFAEQLAAHRHQPMLPWSMIEIPQLWLHIAPINPRIEKNQLLDAPAFAIAMERLRMAGYEHIVIDAPPVLGSADVNLMADAADTVVFALRAQVSTTRDLRKARIAAERIEAGYTWVNSLQVAYDELPFGGTKWSGFGKEHGLEAINFYTEEKSVVIGAA